MELQPHRVEYWLNAKPEDAEKFAAEVTEVCDLYKEAQALAEQGVHLISTDEKTGIQALERAAETIPMTPGQVERQEFEYIRHGTQALIASFVVATGEVIAPHLGDTRAEADFARHIEQIIATDPQGEWIFIADQLNTHQSEALVKLIAKRCGINQELGEKGKSGILASMSSRADFLKDKSHRIRFVYTPKHTSWLNQIEIWFSILARKLLRRSSFSSIAELKARILAFIDYFNKTMAKPYKWTYSGRPLAA
jgi:transposase